MTSPTAPTISATGISAPAFSDILTYLQGQFLSIFGADSYLGNDSQDQQLISVFAKALADGNAAAIAAYNAFSPATAQGTGLASVVKINGLQKLVPSFSSVNLTLTGTAGTVITNGQAIDTAGNLWNLPSTVTIPSTGSVIVTATAVVTGAINAAPGTITGIQTPTYGWQSVTNVSSAIPGSAVESDAALRLRQSQSVSLPSLTIFEGIVAAIENLPGVTRARGYENNTSSSNEIGIPANTLAFIVEGGVALAIQTAIFDKITPGIPTLGNISATIMDANGSTRLINYSTPTDATISVALSINPLTGWSSDIEPIIAAAVAAYVNALPIGDNVGFFPLVVPASLLDTDYAGTYEITGMTIQKNAGAPASADLVLAYNEAPVCASSDVSFTVI